MKIDAGLILDHAGHDPAYSLFWHVARSWADVHPYRKVDLSCLPDLARWLRSQGWCVYYWCDRHGVDTDDWNIYINYGKRKGLIFGRFCPNLTAWLLANT